MICKKNDIIIITGVDGFLGGKICKRILSDTSLNILGLTMDMERVESMLERERIEADNRMRFMMNDVFLDSKTEIRDVYGAVHLAFSRRMQPAQDIASSIVFASKVFHRFSDLKIDRVINMSSQGIYGNTDLIRTEETVPAPTTQYTMAKYASEVLFNDIMHEAKHHTNFRLDPVVQSQNVIKGLCQSAKEGHISLKGGKQVFSFIDAEDAAEAVVKMLMAEGDWDHVYNVGWNQKRYTLTELVELISDVAEESLHIRPTVSLEESDIALWAGMDSSRFMRKTGWEPKIGLKDSLRNLIEGR